MKNSAKKQSFEVKAENSKLTLRGDIDRIRKFVARSLATQVVKNLREEDARKSDQEKSQ